MTVLASGDPLWYGVGAVLARRFPREEMTILPQPSAFSLAAARLGWPLAECATISLHARPLDSLRLQSDAGPAGAGVVRGWRHARAVAALLTGLGWGPSQMTVFSRLGGPREAVAADAAQCWGERRVADLNTIADRLPRRARSKGVAASRRAARRRLRA